MRLMTTMRKLKIFLVLLLSALVILSVFMIYKQISLQHKEADKFDKLIEIDEDTNDDIKNTSETSKDTESSEEIKKVRNLKPLFEKNPDCIGWICIDGTNIDYPVMHTPNNPQKYLRKDFDGEYSQSGVPFLDARCSIESDTMIIYGHNMKNGTQFSDLKKYLSTDFRKSHSIIEFETKDGIRFFTVTAVKTTDVNDEIYNQLNDDGVLMLSTCYGNTKSGRLIIIAKEAYFNG